MVEIKVKSTHSEKRTRDFFKFHLFKISPIRYVYFGIALIFFSLSIVYYLKMKIEISLFFLFVSIIVLVIRIASTTMLLNRVMKNIIFPVRNYLLIFNDDEVVYTYDNFKKTFKWNEILYIYEIKDYIFFYVGKNSSLILSKDSLFEEEAKSLHNLIISSKVSYRKKRFK